MNHRSIVKSYLDGKSNEERVSIMNEDWEWLLGKC